LFTNIQTSLVNQQLNNVPGRLPQLNTQGKRIEKLSKLEHDLIKEVHPQVGDINEGMETIVAAVNENVENNSPESKDKQVHQ
jgi:hypothetical protein